MDSPRRIFLDCYFSDPFTAGRFIHRLNPFDLFVEVFVSAGLTCVMVGGRLDHRSYTVVVDWAMKFGAKRTADISIQEAMQRVHAKRTGQPDGHRVSATQSRVADLAFLIPKRHREPALGDLIDDIQDCRERGWGRCRIWLMIGFQMAYFAKAWPRLLIVGAGAWILSTVRRWLA